MIKRAGIIGFGALGILFGSYISDKIGKENFYVIADRQRCERYRESGFYKNGLYCDMNYVSPEDEVPPLDLLIFGVKYNAMGEALKLSEGFAGENTIFISLLNGIKSEEDIIEKYGPKNVIYSTSQGMDSLKEGNKITYRDMGFLNFGKVGNVGRDETIAELKAFFDRISFPYRLPEDMGRALWGKLLLNTGCNQAAAVFDCCFDVLQREGRERDVMIGAMKEVMLVGRAEGIGLDETDVVYWTKVLDGLNPKGMPSLRQDVLNKRPTEVELFSGTVNRLGKKHGIPTPVNEFLYKEIKKIEENY
ncbi:MAG: 2-dehydropantoate 2-reductase [Clostridiales bacterium]|nr:2-dehydropantoate 2-reductase [Clostridiales bacterium]